MSDTDRRSANPFAPPAARVEDAAPVVGELAGRGARFVASFLDGLAFAALMLLVAAFTPVNLWKPGSTGPAVYWSTYAGVMLAFLALQAWLLQARRQTLGKVAMGIRIVRGDGSEASVGRLVGLRLLPMYLVGLLPIVGPLLSLIDSLLIFRESRRCLHDEIADTVVVRA